MSRPSMTAAQKQALNRMDLNKLADTLRALGFGDILESLIGGMPFISAEITGTGAPQTVAHDGNAAPHKVVFCPTVVPTDGYGVGIAWSFVEGAHTEDNLVFTLTATVKGKLCANFLS